MDVRAEPPPRNWNGRIISIDEDTGRVKRRYQAEALVVSGKLWDKMRDDLEVSQRTETSGAVSWCERCEWICSLGIRSAPGAEEPSLKDYAEQLSRRDRVGYREGADFHPPPDPAPSSSSSSAAAAASYGGDWKGRGGATRVAGRLFMHRRERGPGFIRFSETGYQWSEHDVWVHPSIIERGELHDGDEVEGMAELRPERPPGHGRALVELLAVNGAPVEGITLPPPRQHEPGGPGGSGGGGGPQEAGDAEREGGGRPPEHSGGGGDWGERQGWRHENGHWHGGAGRGEQNQQQQQRQQRGYREGGYGGGERRRYGGPGPSDEAEAGDVGGSGGGGRSGAPRGEVEEKMLEQGPGGDGNLDVQSSWFSCTGKIDAGPKFGFLREHGSSSKDIFIGCALLSRYSLQRGDQVSGHAIQSADGAGAALVQPLTVNGRPVPPLPGFHVPRQHSDRFPNGFDVCGLVSTSNKGQGFVVMDCYGFKKTPNDICIEPHTMEQNGLKSGDFVRGVCIPSRRPGRWVLHAVDQIDRGGWVPGPGPDAAAPGPSRYSTRPRKPNPFVEELKKDLDNSRGEDDSDDMPAPKPKKKRSTGASYNGGQPPEPAPAPYGHMYHATGAPSVPVQPMAMAGPLAVILDIEGTTTPITFVENTLFPYAKQHLRQYLLAHIAEPAVRTDVEQIRAQAESELAAGQDTPQIPAGALEDPAVFEAAIVRIEWEIQHNKKTVGLKSLQGKIWQEGYSSGAIKGEVYEDVPQAIGRWVEKQVSVYIYSSGSVHAQQLLFGHSTAGDLLPYLRGHFDLTTIGPKNLASSYDKIAHALGAAAEKHRLVFATDMYPEAIAARDAGYGQVFLMIRPGNYPLPPTHGFPTATSLSEIAYGHFPPEAAHYAPADGAHAQYAAAAAADAAPADAALAQHAAAPVDAAAAQYAAAAPVDAAHAQYAAAPADAAVAPADAAAAAADAAAVEAAPAAPAEAAPAAAPAEAAPAAAPAEAVPQ
eukprot:tig00021720_g23185.t1